MINENKGAPTGAPHFAVGGGAHDAPPPPVLYEDAAVLVTIKPSGVLSAPAEGKHEKSLPELIFPDKPLFVVHRLDRPTAGVMVYAKTAAAAGFLSTEGEMEKTYLAVCEGVPKEKEARLSDLLFFDRAKDKSYIVSRARRGVKEARLSYQLLETVLPPTEAPAPTDLRPPLSLLRVALDTGRTHQIRAQFAHRGLPLCGDRRYGAKTGGTLGLFAARLSFVHPKTKKRLTFEAPMPNTAPFSFFAE